jgi:hypothetical protein
MTNQKEKAKWFDGLYEKYLQEFSLTHSFEDEPLDEVEFKDKLESLIEQNFGDFE